MNKEQFLKDDSLLSSISDEKLRQHFKKQESKLNLFSLYQDILNRISQTENPNEIQEQLERGANAMNNPNRGDFPKDLFGREAVELIINIAMGQHGQIFTIPCLRFINNVFISNNDFDIDIIKSIPDYDFIFALSQYITESNIQEILSIIELVSNLALKDQETRDHVSELFPLEPLFDLYHSNEIGTIDQVSSFLLSMTTFPIPESSFIRTIASQVLSMLHSETCSNTEFRNKPKIIEQLLQTIYRCMKMEDIRDLFSSVEDFSFFCTHYLYIGSNKIKYYILKLLSFLLDQTDDKELIRSFPLDEICLLFPSKEDLQKINFSDLSERYIKIIYTALQVIYQFSHYNDNTGPVLFTNESFRDSFFALLSIGTTKIRIICAKICLLFSQQNKKTIQMRFLKCRYSERIADLLDEENEEIQLIALKFIWNMCKIAKILGDVSFLAFQLEDYEQTLIDLYDDSESQKVHNYSEQILKAIFPREIAENPWEDEEQES